MHSFIKKYVKDHFDQFRCTDFKQVLQNIDTFIKKKIVPNNQNNKAKFYITDNKDAKPRIAADGIIR